MMRRVSFIARLSLAVVVGFAIAVPAYAQSARISGFVTDRSNGQALEGATIALYRVDFAGTPAYGTVANAKGVYQLRAIRPGSYFLQITFVGYRAYRDTLDIATDDVRTVTVALEPDPEALEEVVVEAGRAFGAAHVTAGHQRIRPEEIELIPTPDISADLANYLTTLPGVVTSGDRGGQFFVRGGEPSQNLTLLDGMTVYQPFHVLGFYSAFPSEVIERVDLHAGGFGARYARRLSSVIDVAARPGNNRRFEAAASVSPFAGAVRLEGPIVPGRASFLVSAGSRSSTAQVKSYMRRRCPFTSETPSEKSSSLPAGATAFRSRSSERTIAEISSARSTTTESRSCAGATAAAASVGWRFRERYPSPPS